MKHVKRFLALSLAAALLAGCVSCGNSDEKTSPTGGGSGVDSTGDGGTLRIAMTCAALPNTDSEPTEGQEGYRFVSFQLYDALVKWDASSETEAGKIIPGLATSWEQNPENPKRWTFHLREGVNCHDGTDFNADCVIFALDRVMNPDFEYYSTTCAASVGSFLANIESYAKVDDYTITIDTVQDNNAYLIYDLPYIMIPSMEAVKEKGDGFADAPVGSGPFRFVSKIAGQELVMERNENYWGNVPQIKTLILKPISDASARLAALQSGEDTSDTGPYTPAASIDFLEPYKLPSVRHQQKPFLNNVISKRDYERLKRGLKRDNNMFWYFVVRFLGATGARVSELIQIKAEHMQIGCMDLYSKGGKVRRIYFPEKLCGEMLSWLDSRQIQTGFIFTNRRGNPITPRGISSQLKVLAKKYRICPDTVYPHSFRHRFAKNFLTKFNDISLLADLMGHESIETTRIYLTRSSDEQRELIDRIVTW